MFRLTVLALLIISDVIHGKALTPLEGKSEALRRMTRHVGIEEAIDEDIGRIRDDLMEAIVEGLEKRTGNDPTPPSMIEPDEVETGGDIEGDILIPDSVRRSPFSVSVYDDAKWPNGIVFYTFASGLDAAIKTKVQTAISRLVKDLEKPDGSKCIDIQPKAASTLDYVTIQSGSGCTSSLGRWPGDNPMKLASRCSEGNIMHEFLHVLGVYHEQSRNDRDDWVTIAKDNILDGYYELAFQKSGFEGKELGSHYDYTSIMHYPKDAFSKNGKDTIIPKKSGASIGQRSGFSACDIERVQVYYGCKAAVTDCAVGKVSPP